MKLTRRRLLAGVASALAAPAIIRPAKADIWRMQGNYGGSGSDFSGILDGLGAVAAWDIGHRLLASYTGPACRLVRASDSAESNFNYDTDGVLDTASVATFLTATTGKVVTIFDQVGDDDLTQGTDANRPAYDATAFNGKPAAVHSDTTFLRASSSSVAADLSGDDAPFSILYTADYNVTGGFDLAFALQHSTTNGLLYFGKQNNETLRIERRDDTATTDTESALYAVDTSPHLLSYTSPGTTIAVYIDETQQVSAGAFNVGTTTYDQIEFGALKGGNSWPGPMMGAAVFDAVVGASPLATLQAAWLALKGL